MTVTFAADGDGTPYVDTTNTDARTLLDLLGLPNGDPLIGTCPAVELLHRIEAAWPRLPDTDDGTGRRPLTVGIEHWGGRPPGWLTAQLDALSGLAEWARERDLAVDWY